MRLTRPRNATYFAASSSTRASSQPRSRAISSATRRAADTPAIRRLVVEVDPPHHHVLDRLRHLPAHRVHHLGLDRRMGRHQPAQQPALAGAEVVDAGRLGAVVAEQVLDALGRDAQLEAALAELRQVGRLAAGQRILVGPGRSGRGRPSRCRSSRAARSTTSAAIAR